MQKEADAVAAGAMDLGDASFLGVYSESFLSSVDQALTAFESDVRQLTPTSGPEVLAAVERVVVALNRVNQETTGDSIDTDEREQLCLFIDEALTERGVAMEELAARHGVSRFAVTDRWRRW